MNDTPGFVDHSQALAVSGKVAGDLGRGSTPPVKAECNARPGPSSIVAIDPGTTESAIVQWDGERVLNARIAPNQEISDALAIVPVGSQLCIEMVSSYGMPVGKEVFETCVWIGRFYQAWLSTTGVHPRLIYRREVKLHHCGSVRAKDGNIRQSLIDKYGPPGTKKGPGRTYGLKSHLWAAFALATYASETVQNL